MARAEWARERVVGEKTRNKSGSRGCRTFEVMLRIQPLVGLGGAAAVGGE